MCEPETCSVVASLTDGPHPHRLPPGDDVIDPLPLDVPEPLLPGDCPDDCPELAPDGPRDDAEPGLVVTMMELLGTLDELDGGTLDGTPDCGELMFDVVGTIDRTDDALGWPLDELDDGGQQAMA